MRIKFEAAPAVDDPTAGGCSGLFTPSDRLLVLPWAVPVEGWYHTGDAVDVHLLNGDAWPEGGAAAVYWVGTLLLGGLIMTAMVLGLADGTRRIRRGVQARRARAGDTA